MQIGFDFLRAFHETESDSSSLERFFRKQSSSKPLIARAVAVDMEAKVVSAIVASTDSRWTYAPDRVYCQRRGAGNNWANGYSSCLSALERVMEMVQAEVSDGEYHVLGAVRLSIVCWKTWTLTTTGVSV